MDTAQTARKALEILDRDGWTQGTVARVIATTRWRAGSHCIGGAWNLAVHGTARWAKNTTIYAPLVQVLRDQYPGFSSESTWDVGYIGAWNDRPDTTEADVRAILEKLAQQEGGQQGC